MLPWLSEAKELKKKYWAKPDIENRIKEGSIQATQSGSDSSA
jgi:hypothetical protein